MRRGEAVSALDDVQDPPFETAHIAEFNLGRLLHDWDDPRVAEFTNALDRVGAAAMRSPGFVWMLDEEAMEREQLDPSGPLGGDARIASTLSVWRDVASLEAFAFGAVHGRFVKRAHLWFEQWDGPRFVMWPITRDRRPTVAEGVARLRRLEKDGAGEAAFDWGWARRRRALTA